MQLRFHILIAFVFIWHATFFVQPLSAHSESVQFITEQLPPLAYTSDGTLTGYNVDLVKYIWKNMRVPEWKIKSQPWPRSIKDFNSNIPTCLFPVSLTDHRRKNYRYVASPISFEMAILAHKKNAQLYSKPEQIKHARICIAKAASILTLLRKQGYTDANFDYGTTFPCGVKKFLKGRAPLIAGGIANIMYNYRLLGGNPLDLRVVSSITKAPNGYLFNDAVPQQFIDQFKQSMEAIADTKEATAIYNKHMRFDYPEL